MKSVRKLGGEPLPDAGRSSARRARAISASVAGDTTTGGQRDGDLGRGEVEVHRSARATGLRRALARIVAHVLDDQRDRGQQAEDPDAEPPAAGDVRPVVRAQVDARQPDRRGEHERAGHERRAATSPSRRVTASAAAIQAVA